MDELDKNLIGLLRHNARMSYSELSGALEVSRTTVRTRLDRLCKEGIITGFSVKLKSDTLLDQLRAMMLISLQGRGILRVVRKLQGFAEVQQIHSTNGKWDLIVELAAPDLQQLDQIITEIRELDGIWQSETNILLQTRKAN